MTSGTRPFIFLRLGRVSLQAGLWPTLGTLLMFPVLIALGVWQLDRAEQKQLLQADYDRHQAQPPLLLHPVLEHAEAVRFRQVRARGQYEPEHQFLLDNRVHQGQVGYHVLTPLRIENGNVRVLVNRGWVPLGRDRSELPNIKTPENRIEVSGVAIVPHGLEFRLGTPPPAGAGWQKVWPYLDLPDYARQVSFPVQPFVILLDVASPADGFVRQWGRFDSGIATHQGYALQWFSLAAALLIIYIFVNIRRSGDADSRAAK